MQTPGEEMLGWRLSSKLGAWIGKKRGLDKRMSFSSVMRRDADREGAENWTKRKKYNVHPQLASAKNIYVQCTCLCEHTKKRNKYVLISGLLIWIKINSTRRKLWRNVLQQPKNPADDQFAISIRSTNGKCPSKLACKPTHQEQFVQIKTLNECI